MEKKSIFILVIILILLGILIFISFAFYKYFKSPEQKLGLGADIESVLISEDGKTAYIKLKGESNKNITKIKFIFTDKESREYNYETSEGAQEIAVPYQRSFWDWLFGKKLVVKYEYQIFNSKVGLESFKDIENVSVVFVYLEGGSSVETPELDTQTNITKIPSCDDGIKNDNETGIDCGGSCRVCAGGGTTPSPEPTPTCTNDKGCTAVGSFCDGSTPYVCSVGGDGCLDRNSENDCASEGKICFNGNCVVAGICGNGILESGESCDDGINNGNIEYCNTECKGLIGNYYVSKEASCNDSYNLTQNDEQHSWCNLSKFSSTCDGIWATYIPIRDIPEGSLVIVKEGNYGVFGEDTTSNCYDDNKVVRSNWTTYKADAGAKVNFKGIILKGHNIQGSHYLIFDGFTINGTVSAQYTEYLKILNLNINVPTKNYDGIYTPYVYTSGITPRDVNYLTIDNCSIVNAMQGMYWGGISHDVTVTNNRILRSGGDAIKYNSITNGLFENNYCEDVYSNYAPKNVYGTKVGDFKDGELVTQAGTGATGYYYSWTAPYYANFFQKTATTFKTVAEGGGTVTGSESGATVSNISKIDGEHTDIIETHSFCDNITIRGNICIASNSAQGITTYGYGGGKNYVVENNLVIGTGKPFVIQGVRNFKFNNNTGIGASYESGTRFEVSTASSWIKAVEVTEMYNNIISEVQVNSDMVDTPTTTGCVYTSSTGNLYKAREAIAAITGAVYDNETGIITKTGAFSLVTTDRNYAVVNGTTIKTGQYKITAATANTIKINTGFGEENNVSVIVYKYAWPDNGQPLERVNTWATVNGPLISDGNYIVTAQTDWNNITIDAGLGDDNNINVTLWGAVKIVSHGNNIFGNNPNGSGGMYKFYINPLNELVNYNLTNLFVDPSKNDFRVKMNSIACNGSINPQGVAVGALPCVLSTEGTSGRVTSLSPFTEIWNWIKGILTKKTGQAILTGKAITGNVVRNVTKLNIR